MCGIKGARASTRQKATAASNSQNNKIVTKLALEKEILMPPPLPKVPEADKKILKQISYHNKMLLLSLLLGLLGQAENVACMKSRAASNGPGMGSSLVSD